ncbi:MAG: hypothetical protein ACI4VF_06440 [Lachnospirales bacterium]
MLNLIYYDLKATIKKLWGYFIFMAILAFIVRFIWSGVFTETLNNDVNDFYLPLIINFVALGALGVIAFVISIAVIVSQTKWFDENILSPQGQLTNMFPVASWQIILSKILTALFWSVILVLMAMGVLSIFLVNTDRFDELMSAIIEIGASNNVNISIGQIIFFSGLFVTTSVTSIITICFTSQLIGQMVNDFRNLITLFSFIGIILVTAFVINILSSILGINIAEISTDIDSIINFAISSAAKLSVINVLIIVVYWLICSNILKRHLNLI